MRRGLPPSWASWGLSLLVLLASCKDEGTTQSTTVCTATKPTCLDSTTLGHCVDHRWEEESCSYCYQQTRGAPEYTAGCLRSLTGDDACVCDSSQASDVYVCGDGFKPYCSGDHSLGYCEDGLVKQKTCDELCGLVPVDPGCAGAAGSNAGQAGQAGQAGCGGAPEPTLPCYFDRARDESYCDCEASP